MEKKKKVKSPCKDNWYKISAPSWNEEFELPDGSYFILPDGSYLFWIYIKKNMEKRLLILQ